MLLSYEGYKETLAKLSRMYRDAYRNFGHKSAQPWRARMRQLRAEHPQHSDRYTKEALGYTGKDVA